MNVLHLSCTFGFALVLVGCGQHQVVVTPPVRTRNSADQEYLRYVAEAHRIETEADVLLTVDGTQGEHSVRLVRPVLFGLTNELSTAVDFETLARALPKHDSAVIRLWAVGWNTNRVTNAAARLRQVGFVPFVQPL